MFPTGKRDVPVLIPKDLYSWPFVQTNQEIDKEKYTYNFFYLSTDQWASQIPSLEKMMKGIG